MSGIVAILHEDGSPVDRTELDRLTESMSFRGPDARSVELFGALGLGHTQLATGFDARMESAIRTLDGEAWIVADARIDDRPALRRSLAERGRTGLEQASDVELILHAYRAWDVECPAHLLGDFSFVIWDRKRERLFCARDRFGVKPLFYARPEGALVVGNTVDTLRLHPDIDDELDESALADYLLFSFHQDPEATDFVDIRRVPAAHTLVWQGGDLSIERYWSLERAPTVRYADDRDYVDHFNDVFGQAVADRSRSPRVAVRMSGGLDSTAIAATAREVSESASRPCEIRAFTGVYRQLIPDREGSWAKMVADHLEIPIHFTVGDRDDDLAEASGPAQEPVEDPLQRAISGFARVALTGFGGDPVNRGSSAYYLDMLRTGQIGPMVGDIRTLLREGKKPPLLARTFWKHWRRRRRLMGAFPSWIDPDLERRLSLRERWRGVYRAEPIGWSIHAEVTAPYWPYILSSHDPGETGSPVDYRHPFFDLRLIRYMMSVPAVPWCMQKLLLRKAMAGKLPAAVLSRPKEILAGHPTEAFLARGSGDWWQQRLERAPAIWRFVRRDAFDNAVRVHFAGGEEDLDGLLRTVYLANWLRHKGLAGGS